MLSDLYKPHISGVITYISLYKRHFESLGHTVFVFTFGEPVESGDEPNVIRSPSLPFSLRYGEEELHLGVRYNREARRLLGTMDVVHVHHPFLSGTLAMRYCRPRGIPIVFTNHTRYDLYFRALLPQLPEGVSRVFLESYLPSFCRACNLVIAPAPGVQNMLLSLGVQTAVEVVPSGVDLSPFRQASQMQSGFTRESIGVSAGNMLLIYVGRLGPEKNLPFMIRAFAGAAEAYPEITLLIVGDGPERDNLEDRVAHMKIGDRVIFSGSVPYERMPDYLALADVFITASTSEVHPLSVIEAMASGLPVLGIRGTGVGDIIEDGVTGFLAREDLAAFTAKLVRLAVEADTRRDMGSAASQVAERFSLERTAGDVLALYQSLIDAAARRNRGLGGRLRSVFRRRGL
jgi:glycosyltransferase involved in cell wall biosynthesis